MWPTMPVRVAPHPQLSARPLPGPVRSVAFPGEGASSWHMMTQPQTLQRWRAYYDRLTPMTRGG
jgi:hypothetical protein